MPAKTSASLNALDILSEAGKSASSVLKTASVTGISASDTAATASATGMVDKAAAAVKSSEAGQEFIGMAKKYALLNSAFCLLSLIL